MAAIQDPNKCTPFVFSRLLYLLGCKPTHSCSGASGPRVVGRVVEVASRIHDLVHVLGLDLEQEGICICVKQLAALALTAPKPVVVEVVDEVFRGVQYSHPDVNGAVEDQTGSSGPGSPQGLHQRCWLVRRLGWLSGAKSVLFVPTRPACGVSPWSSRTHSCSSVCTNPCRNRWWPFSGAWCHPNVGFRPWPLLKAKGPVNLLQTHAGGEVQL